MNENQQAPQDQSNPGIPPLTAVESSQLTHIGFLPNKGLLFVRFHSRTPGKPGSLYAYQNVTQEQADAFMAAESKGRWFGQNLKNATEAHPYRRVAEHD